MTELKKLAGFASTFELDAITDEIVLAAKYCILDSIGAAVGAAHYEEIPRIVAQIYAFVGAEVKNSASVWGHNSTTSAFQAMLINGIMGHALELDDVHVKSKTHIGAVVLPAAWTLAESIGASGKEFLASVIVGYEVMARIGQGFGVSSHRQKGWHVTGTAGPFGAAAACAKLLGLDEVKMLDAFGMAGTQSSGLWAFLQDGASCKKLHPARAAVNGFVAALMANSGMTGPEHILDAADGGLYPAMSDAYDLGLVSKDLGVKFELMAMDKKPYPCCRSTHCAIDAILNLKTNHDVSPDNIQSILVETYAIGVKQCGSQKYPKNSVEAKFSTPYTVAAALVDGCVTLAQFLPAKINDPQIQNVASKIAVKESSKFTDRYPEKWGCGLTVRFYDGSAAEYEVSAASGSVCNPLTAAQSKEKFEHLVSPVLGEDKAAHLMSLILNIDKEKRVPCI